MKKLVLVTGGAGYIGSVLVGRLLNTGFKVKVIDSMMYGGHGLLPYLSSPDFSYLKGDIRSSEDLEQAFQNPVDYVVHLASIVGDPLCAKAPDLAKSTNIDGSKKLYAFSCAKNVKKFLFSSTCSNYGKMSNQDALSYVTEQSALAPVSLYAETKVEVEKYLLREAAKQECQPTCLRFATAFGLSPRMRFDLTVNEFTRDFTLGKSVEVFGEQFWRPYCHVLDISQAVIAVLQAKNEVTAGKVFNVGNTQENYQKKMIVEEIQKMIPAIKYKYVHRTEDPRDYRVSFEKIKNELGLITTKSLQDGLQEIHLAVKSSLFFNDQNHLYSNI